jgi:tetratricopeptide (TPR) repeat protein
MNKRNLVRLALVLLLAVISAPATRPQDESKKSEKTTLSHKRETKDEWSRREPQTGEEWFGRAYELHNSDRYSEAIQAFKHAVDFGYRKGTSMYNIACGYSMLNDKENALTWLQQALDNGFDRTSRIAEDSDLDPLRSDQRFKALLSNMPGDYERERRHSERAKQDRLEQANLDFAQLNHEASKNGERWAEVGLQLLLLRELDRATVALNRAVDYLGDQSASAMYNLACAYSLKGDRETGIQWLEKSVNQGFDNPEKLRYDPDITNLRTNPRFPVIEKLSSTLSLAQFHQDTEEGDKSDSHVYSKERWAPAIQLYESFLKSEPNNGRAWFNLGYALHYSREHTKAIGAFEHALSLGYHKPTTAYNIACGYAMLNQRDAAFEWLDRAFATGFDSFGSLSWDKDLDSLRSDPRFKRFRDSANYNTRLRTKK